MTRTVQISRHSSANFAGIPESDTQCFAIAERKKALAAKPENPQRETKTPAAKPELSFL